MAVYTVHLRGEAPAALAQAKFVREGFSWPAFVFGPVWLLAHRLWLALAAWVVVALVCIVLARNSTSTAVWVMLFAELLVGLEANHARRAALVRRGWHLSDVVAGVGRDDAEGWFFRRQAGPAATPPVASGRSGAARATDPNAAVLGLFPEAEAPR